MRKRNIGLGVAVLVVTSLVAVWWSGRDRGDSAFVERDSRRAVLRQVLPFHGQASDVKRGASAGWLVEPGIASRRVAGVVLADGKPVVAAKVALRSEFARLGNIEVPTRVTDASGRFDFGLQVPTTYALSVMAEAFQVEVVVTNLRNPREEPAPDELLVELQPCASWIYGEVTDLSGERIRNGIIAVAAKISNASWFEELYELPMQTDGTFSLCRPAKSRHQLWIKAAGYQTAWLRDAMPPDGYAVQLLPAGRAKGVVVDEQGAAIANARVVAMAGIRGTGPFALTALSQSDGSFAFTNLSPGRVEFAADHAGYHSIDALWPSAEIEAGQDSAEIRIVMAPLRRLSGVVLDGEVPVVGVRVGTALQAITQEDGSFVTNALRGDELTMKVEGYEVTNPIIAAGDGDITDLVVRVRSRAVVYGRVTSKGKPVVGAVVSVSGNTDPMDFAIHRATRARSGPDGHYQLPGLAKGSHEIRAHHAKTGLRSHAQQIDVGAQGRHPVDFELNVGARVHGVLVDASGQTVANVEMQLTGAVASNTAKNASPGLIHGSKTVTGVDGTFEFRGLASGTYSLCLGWCWKNESDPRYGPLEGDAWPSVAVPNDDSEVELRLVTGATTGLQISGAVVDDTGAPLAFARVQNARRDARTRCDESGHFTLKNLPEGEVELSANVPNKGRSKNVTIAAGATSVKLVVPRLATLKGTIVGGSGLCEVALGSGEPRRSGSHSASGVREFSFADVTPGSHVLEAWCEDGATRTPVDVVPGEENIIEVTVGDSASLHGIVRSFPSGEFLEGYRCSVGMSSATSDAQGEFTLDAVAPGDIEVACSQRMWIGSGAGRTWVALAPGSTSEVDVWVYEASEGEEASFELLGAAMKPVDARQYATIAFHRILSGGAAEQAGIKEGDVLVSVAGAKAQEGAALAAFTYLLYRPPGALIDVVVARGGEQLRLSVQLPTR